MAERLVVTGARGASVAEMARRTGTFLGAEITPEMTDADVLNEPLTGINERVAAATSVTPVAPVRVATTGPITRTGLPVVDGVQLVEGDRVLDKDATIAASRGVYVATASGFWSRASDFDGAGEASQGSYVVVLQGDQSGAWILATPDPIIIGTTAQTWQPFRYSSLAKTDFVPAGEDAKRRPAQDKLRETVSVTDFGAKLDGITNDSPAFAAAVASLTNGGVVRVPPGVKAILSEPITDAGRPIDFVFEGVGVRAPQDQAAFKLTANSSSITMQGSFSNTKVEMHPATQDPVMPTVNITVVAGVVSGVAMTSPGSRIRSPIVCRVRGSSTAQDAVIVFRVNFTTGQASEVTLLDGGGGYANAAAVQLNMEGGGVPLIWSAGPQANRLIGVRLNLGNKMYGVGVLLAGGWYQYWRDVGVDYESIGSKGYGVIIDSRDGPIGTGSFDATYVNTFSNVRAGRMAAIGLDDKTPTTHIFHTVECTYLHLHLCRDFLFTNAVVQGAEDCLIETAFCDSTTFVGGDCEGAPAFIHRSRGTCANTRFLNMRRDATGSAGNYIGEPGTGSVYHFAHSNGTDAPEYIGSGFTSGVAYRNVLWTMKHRIGTPFSGDTRVDSSNIKAVSLEAGFLDDTTRNGFAQIAVGGSISFRMASPGDFVSGTSGPVRLVEYTSFGPSGAAFPAGGVRVAGNKVLGEREDTLPPAATDLSSAIALLNALRAGVVASTGHGLFGG